MSEGYRCIQVLLCEVVCGKFVVEKSMKNADFARVPILVVTYVIGGFTRGTSD